MPDHIHFVLFVTDRTERGLGDYMALFKGKISRATWDAGLLPEKYSVFDEGFNDQILTARRSLSVLIHYVCCNPYRLLVRKENPRFFERKDYKMIAGENCMIYGNVQLLDNPFIEAVIVHRCDDAKEYERKIDLWRYTGLNGAVLAGAFIAPREKPVLKEALEDGYKLILISHIPFPEIFKPAGRLFDLCTLGRLLMLVPLTCSGRPRPTREDCKIMNHLAETLSSGSPSEGVSRRPTVAGLNETDGSPSFPMRPRIFLPKQFCPKLPTDGRPKNPVSSPFPNEGRQKIIENPQTQNNNFF